MEKNETKKEYTPAEIENATDALNDLMVRGETNKGLTYEQCFQILETADPARMKDLSQEYFKFDKQGDYDFIFEGFSEAELQGKKIEVVRLRDKEGSAFINGDKVLVSSCKRLESTPAFIKVSFTGTTKNAAGTYKNLTVRSL